MLNLTPKQTEYLADFASGKTTLQIAKDKNVSHHTVRNTINNARKRAECPNSVNLVALAVYEKAIHKEGTVFK